MDPHYLHSERTKDKFEPRIISDRNKSNENYYNRRQSRNSIFNKDDRSCSDHSARRYKLRTNSKESLNRQPQITETYSQGSINSFKISGNASNSTYK